jgi:chorismate mutase
MLMGLKIEDCRAEIDIIDGELVRLLNMRARLAVEIGVLKRCAALPLYDPDRERGVLARACRANDGPLDDRAVIKIFRRIIGESRRVEARQAESLTATRDGAD